MGSFFSAMGKQLVPVQAWKGRWGGWRRANIEMASTCVASCGVRCHLSIGSFSLLIGKQLVPIPEGCGQGGDKEGVGVCIERGRAGAENEASAFSYGGRGAGANASSSMSEESEESEMEAAERRASAYA
jgi:hypothetical protein